MKKKSGPKSVSMDTLKHGRGIKHALHSASIILGNPIVMIDTSYNLLAYTENTVTDDPLWNELTTIGTFSHETVHFFNIEHYIDDVINSDIVTLLKHNALKYDRMTGKLLNKEMVLFGTITVVGCYRPFEQEDFARVREICEFLSVEIQISKFYGKLRSIFHETYIVRMIEGATDEEAYEKGKMNDLYIGLKANLYVAVVDITQYEHTLSHLVYFRDLFERLQNEYKYFIYLNNIVIILSTDSLMLNTKKDLNILSDFFTRYKIYAGISSAFQNLFELRKYYKEALNALNYGMSISMDQNIYKYDDCRMDLYINSIKDTINFKDLCNPVVFLLQEYDNENNTAYFDIAYTYMLHGGNAQLASEKLNLDQAELHNKLAVIGEIFEIDWNQGNALFNLFNSMKMLKWYRS